jgi:hypothetical protein
MTKDPRPAGPDSIVTPKISCVFSAGFGFIFLLRSLNAAHHEMERFAFGKDPRPVRQRCTKKATRSGRQRGHPCSIGTSKTKRRKGRHVLRMIC